MSFKVKRVSVIHDEKEISNANIVLSAELNRRNRNIINTLITIGWIGGVIGIFYVMFINGDSKSLLTFVNIFGIMGLAIIDTACVMVYRQNIDEVKAGNKEIVKGTIVDNRLVEREVQRDLVTSSERELPMKWQKMTRQLFAPVIKYEYKGRQYEECAENIAASSTHETGKKVKITVDRKNPHNIEVFYPPYAWLITAAVLTALICALAGIVNIAFSMSRM